MIQANRIFPILFFISAVMLTACSFTREGKKEKNDVENFKITNAPISESDLTKISEPAIREIFNGIQKNDYSIFRKPFHEKVSSEEAFQKMAPTFRRKFGELQELKYLDTLQAGLFKATVWKARFAPSAELEEAIRREGRDPKKILVPELLIRLYLGNDNGVWKVYSIIFN